MTTRKLTVSSIVKKKRLNQRFSLLSPKLNISGDWLIAAGFNISDKVEIIVENKKLIIIKN